MDKQLYIGIMSGTSLDGVDVALCQIDTFRCELLASSFYPLEQGLKEEILELIAGTTTLKQIGEIDQRLAFLYAKAVLKLLESEGVNPEDIIAIGSHGQTVWHEPHGVYPFSMQLGNPSVLAVKTGIDVVADFRAKDVAMGGEGAPFAPAFHQFIFSHVEQCAVLNIGGMANITILEDVLIGYDTGCGNVLMDLWVNECKNLPYDADGIWAKSGTVHTKLLNNMLNDAYFKLDYPKSTGREYFNKAFLIKYMESLGTISPEDVQATLLALTVYSIADEIKKFDIKELLVCGGGAKNICLMDTLQATLENVNVVPTEHHGICSESMEAMIFAWFAYKRFNQEAIVLKSVTGTKKNTILGGVYATG
jgi:anhydro-N-acetylmuramic acid kinase